MAKSKLVVGARVVLYVNGRMFGRVTSFEFDSSTPRKPAMGLDSPIPYELIPMGTKVGGSIGLLRLVADGGAEAPGFLAPLEEISREKYFTIALIERSTDTVIFQANNCSTESQSWNVPSRGTMSGTLRFTALTWNNETANSQ